MVADRDLPSGTVIGPDDVRLANLSVANGRDYHDVESEVVGQIVVGGLAAGEAVTDPRLLDPEAGSGLPPGMTPLVVPITDPATLTPLRAGMCINIWAGWLGSPLQQIASSGYFVGVLDDIGRQTGSTDPHGQYPRSHAVIGVTYGDSIRVLEALTMDVFLATVCPAHD